VSAAKARKGEAVAISTSPDWLRIISIGLAVSGILVAGYLAWAEITGGETVCVDTGKIDCEAVQTSAYAKTVGFPVAVLGLLGYVAILGVLILEDQITLLAAYGRTLVIGMTLFGVLFQTIYLTAIEAFVLDAWCQWCVASAVIITLLLILGVVRLYQFLQPLRQ